MHWCDARGLAGQYPSLEDDPEKCEAVFRPDRAAAKYPMRYFEVVLTTKIGNNLSITQDPSLEVAP